jgi:hypothetical protein
MENKEYNKALEVLIQNINEITDFSKEQLPDVARQVLEYGAWDAQYGLTLSTIAACVFGIMFMICIIKVFTSYDTAGSIILSIFSGLFLFLSCIGIMANNSTLKKIEIAPKYYLIQKIRGN